MSLCALRYIIVIVEIKHCNVHYCDNVPIGAALCWRRSPTETSDRAVRDSERDRMLLGSAHAVPEHADRRR